MASSTNDMKVDEVDASVRSVGNVVTFILKLNIIGWVRLILGVFINIILKFNIILI